MSNNLNKLKAILREMFQLDQADLDFGIYRIMNQKRDDIEQFLDRDLLPQVKTAFSAFGTGAKADLQEELAKMKTEIERLGYVAEDNPKYVAKKTELDVAVDVSSLENEVFSQLTNFFRRYYQGGDFLSLRRYKAGVYAIPYEGEEVKLHWANADQYYIKSSENFRDYTFKLPSGKRAHFKLVDASTEQNNKKEQAGKERRFILLEDSPLFEDNGELYIRFEYRVAEESSKQTALNEAAVLTVLAAASDDWKRELSALSPTEKNTKRTLLEKHLNDYTAKYSFDYFIHKDLGGFMRRELDFFIKNEVLFIDDLDIDHVRVSISKVKVIKEIGHKVIAFLEQLENFQKKLWLKKKFVVETGYCATLDKVPEELYPTIISNTAQVEEWKRLFAIQDIEGDLHTPKYTDPLTVEFLKANPFLVIDTAFFDCEFKEKLLASFDNLDESTDGLLVHSDNFQALNIMLEKFREQVKINYIDPPYNTGNGDFQYKDGYKESSWISMMANRLNIADKLLDKQALIFVNIDDNEQACLNTSLKGMFGNERFVSTCIWEKVYSPRMDAKTFSFDHDYILVYSSTSCIKVNKVKFEQYKSQFNIVDPVTKKNYRRRSLRKEGSNSLRTDRPNLYYEIISPDGTSVFPIRSDGREGCWRWEGKTYLEKQGEIEWVNNESGWQPYVKQFHNNEATMPPSTIWRHSDVGHNHEAAEEIKSFFGDNLFTTPKPTRLIQHICRIADENLDGIVLDYFAGSGTTGHAVIKQNRADEGTRKYVLVEMGDHFYTALKPRILKVIYSKDWNNGKPVSREGSSHLFKYIRLESYEDALNNLKLKTQTGVQQSLLVEHDKLREQYMLSYMLDVESAGSASLLNISAFADPFGYSMNIARGNETKETVVDLVETFNWLLGIKVLRISQKEYRTADFEIDVEGRLQIKGRPRTCDKGEGWTFQEVEGKTLSGDKVLVIWRTLTDNPEQDNLMLDTWFGKRNYSTLDFEFARIYVNGDNNLENLKIGEERWKVALIEAEFKKLMFDVEGV